MRDNLSSLNSKSEGGSRVLARMQVNSPSYQMDSTLNGDRKPFLSTRNTEGFVTEQRGGSGTAGGSAGFASAFDFSASCFSCAISSSLPASSLFRLAS